MNPSRLFIERPVATSLLMGAVLLIGMLAFRQLSISALPEVDYPTIQVQTFYPGASPQVMADAVTAPLEKQFGQIPGLSRMTSNSSFGSSIIALQFDLSINIDVAEQDVQAAINAAGTYLPADLPNPPIYNKVNPADMPVLTLALTSKTLPLTEVEKMAETRLAMKISQLPGVGLVSMSGGERPAVRVQANPVALASYGLSLEDLRSALSQANVDMAKGNFDGPKQDWTIEDNDQLFSADDYRPIIIAYRNGAPIRLGDVATVIDGAENSKEAAWFNQTPAILLNIQRQPSANIISLVDRIKKTLPQLKLSLPAGINVRSVSDSTVTIRASVDDVEFELILAVFLVILVIYFFMRSASAAAIPGVAVPLSIVGTFGVMYLLNYSLDNLSLMALTISTGFVVDDAIVMVENIERYIESGDSPVAAALKGSKEIAFTIVSLTISLIAVLIPLLFMGDIIGRLFKEFAVTLAVTILISALVSLSSTPMMASKILRHHKKEDERSFLNWFENLYNQSLSIYEHYLNIVLARQKETMWAFGATLVLTALLFWMVPKGFLPNQDTGALLGISEAPQTISFAEMARRQQSLCHVILQDPAVQSLTSFIGIDGTNITQNSGRVQINLKPISQRPSADQVIRRLDKELSVVPGIRLYLQPVQELTVADQVSRTQYQYTVEGPNMDLVNEWATKLVSVFQTLPSLRDVATDQQNGGLGLRLNIDRDNASRLGILPQTIDNILYDAFGQRQISTIFTDSNQYHVIVENLPQWKEGVNSLERIYVPTSASAGTPGGMAMGNSQSFSTGGVPTPIKSIVSAEEISVPLVINHQGQFPVVTLSFNLAPRTSLGAAVSEVNEAVKKLSAPESLSLGFVGTAQSFESSLANEWILIIAALVAVYIVLGVLYESYIHPLTIISTLPSAGVGALAALILTRQDLDIISLIGIILLIGIVKKNAIMMIDFALEAERIEGKSPREAIYQACLLRFRPIMMTTMAALLGAVPLAFGFGMGAELRRPLGISIIGGLLISQPMTLLMTPVIYLQFDRLKNWIIRNRDLPQITESV